MNEEQAAGKAESIVKVVEAIRCTFADYKRERIKGKMRKGRSKASVSTRPPDELSVGGECISLPHSQAS